MIIGLNKIDALDEEERAFFKEELEAICGQNVLLLSSVSGEGVPEVLRALRRIIDKTKSKAEESDEDFGEWKP
jgi:GTP-binding protein